jgi:hypothetical protein|tara:strand:+ start:2543 stop:2731 length:189 start_codon:yes stop_codon:yes gene_type:complete
MSEIIKFVVDNLEAILGAATAVVTAASALAALTPTPKDDGIVKALYKVVDFLALNIGKAKDS